VIGGRTLAILIAIGAMVGGAIVWPWTTSPTASDGLAPTPPMGFNSWITTYCDDSLDDANDQGHRGRARGQGLEGRRLPVREHR
jgi:alpha-galactosidase